MDKITQSNAASAEESAAAAEELNSQATSLKTAVAELLNLVGAADQKSPASDAPVQKARPASTAPAPKPAPGRKAAPKIPATLPANGNGSHAMNGNGNHRNAIPLEGDFKDF